MKVVVAFISDPVLLKAMLDSTSHVDLSTFLSSAIIISQACLPMS